MNCGRCLRSFCRLRVCTALAFMDFFFCRCSYRCTLAYVVVTNQTGRVADSMNISETGGKAKVRGKAIHLENEKCHGIRNLQF